MICIRPATSAEIPECARQGRRFHEFSPYRDIPYCEASMCSVMQSMVDEGLLIVAFDGEKVIGGIGGATSPMYLNKAHTIAFEMFWWVHEEYRGRHGLKLLKAFEERAKEIGCSFLMMMALSKNDVGKLYTRLGFAEFETGYVKRL